MIRVESPLHDVQITVASQDFLQLLRLIVTLSS